MQHPVFDISARASSYPSYLFSLLFFLSLFLFLEKTFPGHCSPVVETPPSYLMTTPGLTAAFGFYHCKSLGFLLDSVCLVVPPPPPPHSPVTGLVQRPPPVTSDILGGDGFLLRRRRIFFWLVQRSPPVRH